MERALKKLEREADLKSRTYPLAMSKALLEVDEHMASRDYEAAHIAINQLVQVGNLGISVLSFKMK